MNWRTRLLVRLPLVIAAVLTFLLSTPNNWVIGRSHSLEKYVFLFALPWAWLVDSTRAPRLHNHVADVLVTYAMLLWLPALLYSLCIWAVIRVCGLGKKPKSQASG